MKNPMRLKAEHNLVRRFSYATTDRVRTDTLKLFLAMRNFSRKYKLAEDRRWEPDGIVSRGMKRFIEWNWQK